MAGAGVQPTPAQVLKELFGFDSFRPGQEELIRVVLEGRDCIGVMPTGSGKSLTFQIPARILPGTVLVISPLISLMKDQVDALDALGYRAAAFNSSLEPDQRQEILRRLRRHELELLYVAPEALDGPLRQVLEECALSLVVVDEAHCISTWGHDFRPSYRRLRGLKSALGGIPVLALTATATRRVALDIVRELGMQKPGGYKGSFFRPNLKLWTRKKGEGSTRREILGIVRAHRGESGIVYCLSRKSVESTARFLCENGVRALPYHAGMEPGDRNRNQESFSRDDCEVIVATVAFGMGIDKSNVRFIVHRDLPKSVEAWAQEIGRAGRDGEDSDCVLFFSWADVIAHERFLAEIENPEYRQSTRSKTVELFELADSATCRHQGLVSHFGEHIDRCGESCDACRGAGLAELINDGSAPECEGPVRRRSRKAAPVALSGAALGLFRRLKALRKTLADREGKPAFVIFSDAVLRRLATEQPRTPEQMLGISGIGTAKLERYGEAFLAEILGAAADA